MGRPAREHPHMGVLSKGMSGIERTGRGGIDSGGVRTSDRPGTGKPQGSGSGAVGQDLDAMEMPSSWQVTMVAALFI